MDKPITILFTCWQTSGLLCVPLIAVRSGSSARGEKATRRNYWRKERRNRKENVWCAGSSRISSSFIMKPQTGSPRQMAGVCVGGLLPTTVKKKNMLVFYQVSTLTQSLTPDCSAPLCCHGSPVPAITQTLSGFPWQSCPKYCLPSQCQLLTHQYCLDFFFMTTHWHKCINIDNLWKDSTQCSYKC